MRDYAKIGPKAWQGQTFKKLRKEGMEGLLVALYLMSSPSSNMLGLYSQPILYMAHETGLGHEGALKGLTQCIEAGFCTYDHDTEMVWVYEMAKYQVAAELKATDLRCKGIQKDYDSLPDNPFLGPFFDHYAAVFHLTNRREFEDGMQGALIAPYQAPSKPRTGAGAGTRTGFQGATAPLPPAQPAATPPSLSLPADPGMPSIPPCPVQQLVNLFVAKCCPELPKPRYEMWKDSKGADAMRQRWKWLLSADAKREDDSRYATTAADAIEWFGLFFDKVHESDFLSGRNGAWKNCDLTWLMNRENFMKVVQGNYANERETA